MSQALAGLYLHVPFCSRVCPYCDFAVRTGDRARRRRYVDHLVREIGLYRAYPLRFDSIYFGGGTPSSLEPEDIDRILSAARECLDLDADTRIFLEANPEDVTPALVAAWRGLGVDTVSLGVQSLDADELEYLGRRHDPAQARRSVAMARSAGFHTVSIDLIYGLPGRDLDDWRRGMDLALETSPDHVSCYQLTIHPRTRFHLLEARGALAQLSDDRKADVFRLTHEHMNASGVAGYEVSQFATAPRHRSRHNMKYWDHTPYLGLGPSAHSFHDGQRWWNVRRTDPWQDRVAAGRRPVEQSERIDRGALLLEALMTGMRTYAGVDFGRLERLSGADLLATNGALVRRLVSDGLGTLEDRRFVPTLDGLAVADGIAPLFELPS